MKQIQIKKEIMQEMNEVLASKKLNFEKSGHSDAWLYEERPAVYLAGSRDGIITKAVPIVYPYAADGCWSMLTLTSDALAQNYIRLIKSNTIPCGIIRVGINLSLQNGPYYWVKERHKNEYCWAENLILISVSDNKGIEVSSLEQGDMELCLV